MICGDTVYVTHLIKEYEVCIIDTVTVDELL